MDLFGDLPPPSEEKKKAESDLFGDIPPPGSAAAGQKRSSRDPLDAAADESPPQPKARKNSCMMMRHSVCVNGNRLRMLCVCVCVCERERENK